MSTKIEWTDESWNPVVGCTKVSAGCQNCYAEKFAVRLAAMGRHKYRYAADKNGWTGSIECCDLCLEQPLHWRKPRMIFICSMGDLFHEAVPFEFIDRVWGICAVCPQHTFQWLTKRPEIAKDYFESRRKQLSELAILPNLWLGTSISTQEDADKNIPILLQILAAVRFVSVEPMLGEIDFLEWFHANDFTTGESGIDWVIIGCESGPKRRECKLEWVRDLVEQCKAAKVPVFVKQLSINGKVEHDIKKFPKDLQVREYPKGGE